VETNYGGIYSFHTPPATASHVPLPHFRLVDMINVATFVLNGKVTENPHLTNQLYTIIDVVCERVD
jgi:hypothetical protein